MPDARPGWPHCAAARRCSARWAACWASSASRLPISSPAAVNELVGKLMTLLIDLRAESRKKKDFATADTIRKRLGEIGVVLEDRPGGTEWTVG